MNIFYINSDTRQIALEMCDEHILKMGVETAQMLSTAHRILDGVQYTEEKVTNDKKRKLKRWRLNDEREAILYKATHINHPQNKWVRFNRSNYLWAYDLFIRIMDEFVYRYDNENHKTMQLLCHLDSPPKNIDNGEFYVPPLTMPDEYKCSDPVRSYRKFYVKEKSFATWVRKRDKPLWMVEQSY